MATNRKRRKGSKRQPTRAEGKQVVRHAIELPGLGSWYAETALQAARLADRIQTFRDADTIGNYSDEFDKAVETLEGMVADFWKWCGVEVELLNHPEGEGVKRAEK